MLHSLFLLLRLPSSLGQSEPTEQALFAELQDAPELLGVDVPRGLAEAVSRHQTAHLFLALLDERGRYGEAHRLRLREKLGEGGAAGEVSWCLGALRGGREGFRRVRRTQVRVGELFSTLH